MGLHFPINNTILSFLRTMFKFRMVKATVLLGMLLCVTAQNRANRLERQAACQTVYDRMGSLCARDLKAELTAQGFTVTMGKATNAVDRFNTNRAQARTQADNRFQAQRAQGQQRAAANQAQWDANAPALNREIRDAQDARNRQSAHLYNQGRRY